MIEFDKTEDVSAASTAIAIEQAFVCIHQKAGLAVWVQRTQSHPSVSGELSNRPPILSLQIVQQRNPLLQIVESKASHGLLASFGRIRRAARRSQATMVGGRRNRSRPAANAHQILSRRRCPQRRRVVASG